MSTRPHRDARDNRLRHWLRLHLLRLQAGKHFIVDCRHWAGLHGRLGHRHFLLQERGVSRMDFLFRKLSQTALLHVPASNLSLERPGIYTFEQQFGNGIKFRPVLVGDRLDNVLVNLGLVDGLGVQRPLGDNH